MELRCACCQPGLARVPATSRLCRSLATRSQEAKHGLGNLMLIGIGLFLLPNMQTARGVQSVPCSAFPSERLPGFASLLLPLLCSVSQTPAAGRGSCVGRMSLVAVERWNHSTGQTGSVVAGQLFLGWLFQGSS